MTNEDLKTVRAIDLLIEVRDVYKERKDYEMSDMIRRELNEMGVVVIDKGEVKWKFK